MSGNARSGYRPAGRLEPCGTASARRRHIRLGEPVDQACREAHAAEERARYQPVSPARRRRAEERRLAAIAAQAAWRREEYAFFRGFGMPPWEAAARIGIRDAQTIRQYEEAS
jgi:hypothetical protein